MPTSSSFFSSPSEHRVTLEQNIQLRKQNRPALFIGSTIALICSLFSNGLYALRHPNDFQFQLLLTLNVGLTIGVFCYALQNYNQTIIELETAIKTHHHKNDIDKGFSNASLDRHITSP